MEVPATADAVVARYGQPRSRTSREIRYFVENEVGADEVIFFLGDEKVQRVAIRYFLD